MTEELNLDFRYVTGMDINLKTFIGKESSLRRVIRHYKEAHKSEPKKK